MGWCRVESSVLDMLSSKKAEMMFAVLLTWALIGIVSL